MTDHDSDPLFTRATAALRASQPGHDADMERLIGWDAYVVDGVTWVADPHAPLSPEQWFGHRNSVIVVPEDRRS